MTINYSLGKALTTTATLPPNARRDFPPFFAGSGIRPWIVLAVLLALGAAAVWLWFHPAALDLSFFRRTG
jgi:hypothetical protein